MREYSAILGPVDSAFYYVDRPETPMNIGAMSIFDGKLDFDTLVNHIDSRLHQIPRYRDRVIQAPLNLGQPTWIPDPDFFIGNHIKRIRVDAPGTVVELQKLAGRLLSRMLDRDRPLWEIYVIEGLENDQTALFFKVHHCMVDGLSAVELFTFLVDIRPDAPAHPRPGDRKPLFDPYPLPDPIELTFDSIFRDIGHQFGLLQKLGRETLRMSQVLINREQRLKMLLAVAHLINDNLRPIKKLPINGQNSGRQHMVWVEFPLAEIHTIRAQCGASVNDVMLSLLARAVENYSAMRGLVDQPFMRVLVPFNMRDEAEQGEYGNRISVLPIDVPFNIADPMEHLKAVTRFSKAMKESSLAYSMDLVLTLPAMLPAVTHSPIWNLAPLAFSLLAHTWCTNVAAMPIPVYLLGREMTHVYGYFPLNPSMGMAAVVLSYNGKITLSLMTDQAIVDDPDALIKGLKEAYSDLIRGLPQSKSERKSPTPAPVSTENPPKSPSPKPSAPVAAAVPAVEVAPAGEVAPADTPVLSEEPASVVKPEPTADISPTPDPLPAGTGGSVDVIIENESAPAVDAIAALAVQPLLEVVHQNGGTQVQARPVPVAQPTINEPLHASAPILTRSVPKLFSADWAAALHEEINRSDAYRTVSLNWNAGPLTFVMETAPAHGFDTPAAVWLDLYRGVCRGARALAVQEASRDSSFVIQGAYGAWMDLLAGRSAPLLMLTNGRLKLKKGALHRLLPYTRSASELVHCAQRVPWQ